MVSLLKRALWDIARAGVPRFRGGIIGVIDDVHEVVEDVREGNENLKFIRDTFTADTVNEIAERRAGEVEEAMFVGRVAKRVHELHRRKTRKGP